MEPAVVRLHEYKTQLHLISRSYGLSTMHRSACLLQIAPLKWQHNHPLTGTFIKLKELITSAQRLLLHGQEHLMMLAWFFSIKFLLFSLLIFHRPPPNRSAEWENVTAQGFPSFQDIPPDFDSRFFKSTKQSFSTPSAESKAYMQIWYRDM